MTRSTKDFVTGMICLGLLGVTIWGLYCSLMRAVGAGMQRGLQPLTTQGYLTLWGPAAFASIFLLVWIVFVSAGGRRN